jgi:anti-anti-sigma factor
MPVHEWSDEILLAELASEPEFSDDIAAVNDLLDAEAHHVVLNLAAVGHLNSSNLAQLLRVRKRVTEAERALFLCAVPDEVWGVLLVTGLDKVFNVAEDVPSALASLQMDSSPGTRP